MCAFVRDSTAEIAEHAENTKKKQWKGFCALRRDSTAEIAEHAEKKSI